ncbi:hypothetical protein [Deinococcus multiflagellatus]|uniref:Exonuclease domain-containing protein n=1 Tax=Deinococcus multiflagellatus TaxID=1656887 RepID=A0ABW1ZPQ1_9DEIO|nr:hypothetical protein [Deinococcus multiflagellatus]MBZ9715599.1 hypothetical protein [Deinococcus multiflagellatus]
MFQRWAADSLSLIVDTETTDLTGEAWEVEADWLHDTALLLHLRGEPDTEWHTQALAMHLPVIQDQLRGLPHLRTHTSAVGGVLTRHHVLAYNEAFDRSVLECTCGLSLNSFGCVMLAYAPLAARWSGTYGRWKAVKLAEARALEGVPVERRTVHSALGDVQPTRDLILAVAR